MYSREKICLQVNEKEKKSLYTPVKFWLKKGTVTKIRVKYRKSMSFVCKNYIKLCKIRM